MITPTRAVHLGARALAIAAIWACSAVEVAGPRAAVHFQLRPDPLAR